MAENDVDHELLDYEEDEEPQGAPESAAPAGKKEVKGSYVSIHSSGFRDFLLKPELLRAIIDCGFEHPSEGKTVSVSLCPSGLSVGVIGLCNGYLCALSFSLQSSTSVSPRLSWAWTSCVKLSLVWARPLFLCWQPCSRLSLWTDRLVVVFIFYNVNHTKPCGS